MSKEAEYAVRVSKFEAGERPQVHIMFGPKSHVDKKFNAVEITSFPGKMVFRFFVKGDGESFRSGGSSAFTKAKSKKFTLYRPNSNLTRAVIRDINFMNEFDGFEGEYYDLCTDAKYELSDKLKDEFKCWINLSSKESYTNMYKNSSATVKPTKKLDIPNDETIKESKEMIENVTMPLPENSISEMLQKQTTAFKEGLNKLFGVPKIDPNTYDGVEDPRKHVDELLKELTYTAHKCTDEIQRSMADIFDYQLRKIHVTYEEANTNIKLQQILLRYIKLQDELEELFGGTDDAV